MKILRVNMENQTSSWEDVPEKWKLLGGRGLSAKILLDEVDPTCDPLGPGNKLIFAPGLLTGHRLSSLDRISIGGKSPLTGGIKEANAGGSTGYHLAKLGIKALIIEEQPADEEWQVLFISKKEVQFLEGEKYYGMGVYQTAHLLVEEHSDQCAMALIGPGGEMELRAAGIQNLDKDFVPSRIAARGGLGAVMGSKRVKAIVIDSSEGEKPPIADQAAFREARNAYTKSLMDHPQTQTYRDYGTASMTNMTNHFGCLPTRGFSAGTFESAEKISGEQLRDTLLDRGGESKTSHACMPGCTIQCSNVFGGEDGKTLVSPLEYETIGLMGSNLGIDDLDTIARLNLEMNDQGLDTIEIGSALGVAAQAGHFNWGDGDRIFELISEIRAGTPLGRVLGNGASITGQVLGVERVPAVKGQAMPAYDPRTLKGTGVTYATSPQGADHTCGLTIRTHVKHTDPKGQVDISRSGQISMAGYDTLGVCIFAGSGFAAAPDTISSLLNARYGWEVDEDVLQKLGGECLRLEREFNRRAGFTQKDDRLPEWMTLEPLPPLNSVFDVDDDEMDTIFDFLDDHEV